MDASACSCNSGFSNSYMLLKPEEVKFFDLLRLLFSSNLKKRKFVDSTSAREHNFWHRFFIFLSIIVLKLLRFFAKPLALLGFFLESWLNFISANGGFSGILLNILRFKLIIPDSSSAEYLSIIGHLDSRVRLDEKIKAGDVNYFGALCMMASKLVYENEAYVTQTVNHVWKVQNFVLNA
ncbi:uncharacterized protein LOC111786700 [Cucurbita pepo subsp. pepo]|uniref:uncharacterized protein LOC111786700 n=1 Tax=Cucurbita pepo subsp. pepo TaxID=3664 RepID=UPI000C9D7171|nr:uncharacterized protein LOC111786700 [Cucurbita pepo subsp. pepo]